MFAFLYRSSGPRLLGMVLAIGCALIVGSHLLLERAVERWVVHDAEEEAMNWAMHFASQLQDLDAITRGDAPSPESQSLIRHVRQMGRVFRFKIFDNAGVLRFVSDERRRVEDETLTLVEHNAEAAQTVLTQTPFTEVKEGTPPQRPELYAETYLPVIVDGTVKAVLEVYVDQSTRAEHFRADVRRTGLWLTGLTTLAFSIPYAAFLLRNRQKRFADARLHFLAHHDPMTQVLNRRAFVEKLDKALDKARARGETIAVHYIDLDHFKAINDSLGHGIGDSLIRAFAERASVMIGPGDLIGRFGGDEFVIAQRRVGDVAEAENMAAAFVTGLAGPYTLGEHDVAATLSVGCALAPSDAATADELLKCADLALYFVKSSGRNGHAFYRATMSEELLARRALEARLKQATHDESFELHFQPVVSANGSRISGFEALLRLPDDGRDYVSPATFIPLAESMGLIPRIGAWVIRKACETAMAWPEDYTIAVNLSPAQFADGKVAQTVADVLEDTGLAPARLELEITEGLLLSDTASTMAQLQALKALGVSIVMDDFGTGYSSLSYLWRFPFDKIKIDRSFVQAFDGADENVASILRTIVSLGHSLKMCVTAEGVETREQAALMEELACDQIQGFLYGRPIPASEIASQVLAHFASKTADGPEAAEPADVAPMARGA